MIITKITSNGKNEFNLELSDQTSVVLTEDVFVRHNLYKGKEITKNEIECLKIESKVQEAITLSIRRLNNRKTEYEIRTLLTIEGFEEAVIDRAIDYLYEYKFLDDREYALLYARDKTNINKYGQVKIAYALRQKGVSDHLISIALDEVFDRQTEIAWTLYNKRKDRYDLSNYKDRGRLSNYLSQRGFTYDTIQSIIKRGQNE